MWIREMNLETEFPLRLLGTQMLVVSCPCQPMTWLGLLFWPMTQLCLCDTILMMLDKDWWLPELCRYLDSTLSLVCISVTPCIWRHSSGWHHSWLVTCVMLIRVICDQLTPGEEGLIHADIGDNDSTRDGSHYQPPSFIITSAVTREEQDAKGSRTHRIQSDQDICFANFLQIVLTHTLGQVLPDLIRLQSKAVKHEFNCMTTFTQLAQTWISILIWKMQIVWRTWTDILEHKLDIVGAAVKL